MPDEFAPALAAGAPIAGSNLPVYSVGELSASVKRTLEDGFARVRVRGELSGTNRHRSGHVYMTLKDEVACLDAVCWRGVAAGLSLRPEDGMEVVVTGRLTTYPARSRYQLVVESMELAGEGALLKLLEERRRRLAAEGLFDAARKRPIPFLPTVIGVVTSPSGAVIRDILHRLADRFPRRVLLWPVAVQGDGAAEQIAAAIAGFNALAPDGAVPRPDLLIVARGGGSLEDLMPFNDEAVVRAAAASRIPLIAAVGHETDVTLIDHAADRRAPTPTAAAEMAVPVRAELLARLLDLERRQVAAAARLIDERRLRVVGLARGLGDPQRLLDTCWQRLDDRGERLDQALPVLVQRKQGQAAALWARLPHPRHALGTAAQHLRRVAEQLGSIGRHELARQGYRLRPWAERLSPQPVARTLDERGRRLAEAARRLPLARNQILDRAESRLDAQAKLLESYSYRDVLRRGYAVVRDAAGQPVCSADDLRAGAAVALEFGDETTARAVVTGPGTGARPANGAGRRPSGPKDQGRLF